MQLVQTHQGMDCNSIRILGSHEFFYAIQAAYDREQGTIFSEGTAVWATETFDSSLYDFEYFIDGYLNNTGRSLDVPLVARVEAARVEAA